MVFWLEMRYGRFTIFSYIGIGTTNAFISNYSVKSFHALGIACKWHLTTRQVSLRGMFARCFFSCMLANSTVWQFHFASVKWYTPSYLIVVFASECPYPFSYWYIPLYLFVPFLVWSAPPLARGGSSLQYRIHLHCCCCCGIIYLD